MSEIRQDIFTGEWVIYATNRKKRPYDFNKCVLQPKDEIKCSFCIGHENETPNPTYQNHENGMWTIRCFENKYPMIDLENATEDKDDFYVHEKGKGIHEVLVDTPNHDEKIHEFTKGHLIEVLEVLQKRYCAIKLCEGIKYIQIFKNTGPDAGASIMHSHWQISGVPFVPFLQECVLNNIVKSNKHLYKEMINHEKKENKRVIYENEYFIALVPYAAKYSYEICIFSKDCISSYDQFEKKHIESLGDILNYVLDKSSKVRQDICYNICFMDIPDKSVEKNYCWHARIIPRIGSLAGFEMGTAGYINPVLPEEATEYIKNLD